MTVRARLLRSLPAAACVLAVGAPVPAHANGAEQHQEHAEHAGQHDAEPGLHDADAGQEEHDGHSGQPDSVSDTTRATVLGGFGAVNAAALAGALVLRRRDRRTARKGVRR